MIVIKREELLDDINHYAYVEADTMQTENEHDRHQTLDILEDGNINRVTRILNRTYSECVHLLSPYGIRKSGQYCTDDTLTERNEYDILLLLPEGIPYTTVEYLKDLIHDYMVFQVLAEWLSITYSAASEKWLVKAEDTKSKIKGEMAFRFTKQRIRMSPFA